MTIAFSCACGKRLRAKDEWAGKRVKCPGCGSPLVIPDAADDAPTYPVAPPPRDETEEARVQAAARERGRLEAAAAERYKHLFQEEKPFSWRDHAYWLLLFTLIPLGFSLLGRDTETIEARLARTIDKAPLDVQLRIAQTLKAVEEGKGQPDDLFAALPGGRIEGSHLPRKTFVHYLYALLAAGGFFALGLFLVPAQDSRPLHLLLLGLFTGTIGIVLLLVAQFLAEATQGRLFISRSPVLLILYYVAYAIGFSYRAALDAETGFLASFLGYTFGVGLCEEVCKALPVIFYYRTSANANWRMACTWGFASGVGFGVAEAILYAGDHYNGLATAGIYVVRFVSCVALHAIWSMSSALFIHKYRSFLQGDLAWHDYIPRVIFLVAIPMVLHGLYDTALKKEVNWLALVAALVSFGWLAWCLWTADEAKEVKPAKVRPRYA
jgi:RsiW-degrading membrane proteinase PrsW (M82 family)